MYVNFQIANAALRIHVIRRRATADLASRQPRQHKRTERWLHSTLYKGVISANWNIVFQLTVSSPRSPSQTAKDDLDLRAKYWLTLMSIQCSYCPRKAMATVVIQWPVVLRSKSERFVIWSLTAVIRAMVAVWVVTSLLAGRVPRYLIWRDDVTLSIGFVVQFELCVEGRWGSFRRSLVILISDRSRCNRGWLRVQLHLEI